MSANDRINVPSSKSTAHTMTPPRHLRFAYVTFIANVSTLSHDTHWSRSHVTISAAAFLSSVTLAPSSIICAISCADNTPGVPVQAPPLPPLLNSHPASRQDGFFMVKERP